MSTCLHSSDDFFSFLDKKDNNNLKNKEEDIWDLFKECKNEINTNDNLSKDNLNSIEKINNQINDDDYDDICEYCKAEDCLINDNETIVCSACGIVNRTIIDNNPEWRFYGNDDNKRSSDPNRCGGPLSPYIQNGTLSIVILGHGNEQFRKVNRFNGLTYKERSFMTILNSITNKASLENLPQSIIDQTIHLYQNVCAPYVKKGTSDQSLLANCFAHSLKQKKFIRTNNEIAKLFNISSRKFSKGNTEFYEYLEAYNKKNNKNLSNITAKELITQYAKMLDFTPQQIRSCLYALYVVYRLGLCPENNPKSISTGIIYLVSEDCGLPYTKRDIAEYCKTSEVTVGGTYSQMVRYKNHLIPPNKN